MRVGIDCRMWNETGVGRYIRNIVTELSKLDPKNEYVVFLLSANMNSVNLPSNFKKVAADIRWHSFSEQFILPIIYYRENLDLLFVPHFNVPILYLKNFIVTIHDLTILRVNTGRASTLPYPIYIVKKFGFVLTMFMSLLRAKKIFTVSEYVKQDICNVFHVSKSKIALTPNAVASNFINIDKTKVASVTEKYNIQKPYIFYVGNAHPHKNVESLIKAFKEVHQKLPEIYLVLGGNKAFFYERIESEILKEDYSKFIKFIGFVDDEDLPYLYAGSELFVNPSYREGFGIQVLEAFATGTKVACSNTSSLPEVGSDFAFYFDPYDVKNIADTILKALSDRSQDKISGGLKRVNDYSWKSSANVVFNTINEISNSLR